MDDTDHVLTDRQLLEAARDGSDDAWSALVQRHRAPVVAVAREVHGRRGSATAERAFDELRQLDVIDELDADAASTAFAIRAVRPRAMASVTGGTYGPSPPQSFGPDSDSVLTSDPVLTTVAVAFGRLSMIWQTVLWHRLVDRESAAAIAPTIGRTPAEVVAVEAAAKRGLFEAQLAAELDSEGLVAAACRPIVGLLGAYASGTLSDAQRRSVEAHLGPADEADPELGPPLQRRACADCHRRLERRDRLGELVPIAVVPGVAAMDVERYRRVVGVSAALGATALGAQRAERAKRRALVLAGFAVVAALLIAAFAIRSPFGDLEGEIAELLERTSTTTTVPDTASPTTSLPVTTPPPDGAPDALASRIELVFPGVPQGIAYVPGGPAVTVGLDLSVPAPVYRNGTGTIDAALSNANDTEQTVEFVVRTSPGVSFDQLVEGVGTCASEGSGAQCSLELAAGQTGALSLRFTLDASVADRLLVVPNISSQTLDLPIETVPGLALAQVGRGDLVIAGNSFGSCPDPRCDDGGPDVSSAVLDLPSGVAVDRAVLVWTGPDADPASVGSATLTLPGDATGLILRADRRDDGAGPRSVADVTDLVRAGGAGSYIVRRTGATAEGGAWSLIVATRDAAAPRRLVVAVAPPGIDDGAASVSVPVAPPVAGPPPAPTRAASVRVQLDRDPAPADPVVEVNGVALGSPDAAGAYALEIDANDDPLTVRVSPPRALGVSAIGAAIDIVT